MGYQVIKRFPLFLMVVMHKCLSILIHFSAALAKANRKDVATFQLMGTGCLFWNINSPFLS